MKAFEKRRRMAGQQGFTLIELLIVIAILGILAAVVVFAVGNVTDNAETSACEIEFRSVRTAIQAYRADTGQWPTAFTGQLDEWLEEAPTIVTINYGATSADEPTTTPAAVSGC